MCCQSVVSMGVLIVFGEASMSSPTRSAFCQHVHRCFLCPPRVYDTGWHQQRWLQQLAVMVAVGTLGGEKKQAWWQWEVTTRG
uniref:Secreted protein n=1 Tax=Oryza sativa subsp. japonica TaxID=39947 RepID=Q6YWG8_ORYSJ|nr:hypothetical protein [Oryza sativa Japonica Group]